MAALEWTPNLLCAAWVAKNVPEREAKGRFKCLEDAAGGRMIGDGVMCGSEK